MRTHKEVSKITIMLLILMAFRKIICYKICVMNIWDCETAIRIFKYRIFRMPKIPTQAKHIAIFILLLTVVPLGFVKGFFAYLNYVEDEELTQILKITGKVYYDLCMDAAIISFVLTYLAVHFIKKANTIPMWLKFLLAVILYLVLFFIWQFVLVFLLENI